MAESLRLFDPLREKVNLWAPFVVGLLCVFEFTVWGALSPGEIHVWRFIACVFFFNTVHVVFTFGMMFYLPELRDLIRVRDRERQWWMKSWIEFAALGLAIFAGFYILLFERSDTPAWLVGPLRFCVLFFPIQHGLSQVFGISNSYNFLAISNLPLSDEERARVMKSAKREQGLTKIYLFMWALQLTVATFSYDYWKMLLPWRSHINWTMMGLMYGMVALIYLNAAMMPRAFATNKMWFLGRYLIFPLSVVSTYALIGKLVFHGLEYWGVYGLMRKNSSAPEAEKSRLVAFVVVTGLVMAVLTACRPSFMEYILGLRLHELPTLPLMAGNLMLTLSFLHYYLDRVIFRMRNRETQARVAPLLFGPQHGLRT